jgi:hypothetical protein
MMLKGTKVSQSIEATVEQDSSEPQLERRDRRIIQ